MNIEIGIDTYENSDEQKPAIVIVKSHWHIDDFSEIVIDGKSAIINRHEMISALQRSGCKI